MWLGLAFPGTRLFIQRKKKRAPKPKNNIGIELSKQITVLSKSGRIMWLGLAFPGTRLFIQRKKKAIAKTEK